jgi:hypothetical protein
MSRARSGCAGAAPDLRHLPRDPEALAVLARMDAADAADDGAHVAIDFTDGTPAEQADERDSLRYAVIYADDGKLLGMDLGPDHWEVEADRGGCFMHWRFADDPWGPTLAEDPEEGLFSRIDPVVHGAGTTTVTAQEWRSGQPVDEHITVEDATGRMLTYSGGGVVETFDWSVTVTPIPPPEPVC